MKIYGIAREGWDGYKYSCNYNEDITLYTSEKERDKDYFTLVRTTRTSFFDYTRFETELKE